MKNQQIFITGGAGFIGANLVKYLLNIDGHAVTVYDNLCVGSRVNLGKAVKDSRQKDKIKFIKGDILNFAKLNRTMKGHDAIIHLAAHTKVIESLKNPAENFAVNSMGTFNVLEAARKNRIKKFIFASSNAAVGEQAPPINEKTLPRPISPYGAGKLYGESLCCAYFYAYGLNTVSLRFANAYGPYSKHKSSVIAKFINRAKKNESLEIYGDGNQTRDFIHAQDICRAIYLSLGSKVAIYGEIFQIATGIETKIIDLAKLIKKLTDASGSKSLKIYFKSKRKGEIRENFSNITKARKRLLFAPKITLSNGLKEMWNMGK